MPGSPDSAEHQCRPESVETMLQPGKRETAPAHLLEQSNDDDRRDQSYTNAQPVCIGSDIRCWRPTCDREGSRDRSQNKGTQQGHDIPDWMHPPAEQLSE